MQIALLERRKQPQGMQGGGSRSRSRSLLLGLLCSSVMVAAGDGRIGTSLPSIIPPSSSSSASAAKSHGLQQRNAPRLSPSSSSPLAFAGSFAPLKTSKCGTPSDVSPPPAAAAAAASSSRVNQIRKQDLVIGRGRSLERARLFSAQKGAIFSRRDSTKRHLSPRSGLLGSTAVFLPDDTTPSFQDDESEDSRSSSRSQPRSPGRGSDSWGEDSSRGYGVGYAYDPLNFDGESAADLNERLRPTGLEMHRLKLKPDEAFGSVFRFEGVISDTQPVHKAAWVKVATEMNLTLPDDDDVRMAMGMPAEKAIQRVMCWTQDWGETKRIAFRKAELFYETFQDYNHSIPSATQSWLHRLNASSIPVCLCSDMDRGSVEAVLEKAGVGGLYTELIAAEDDCDTRAQMYLGAAAKLMRPPQKIVIFDSDPEGISAARDISAQVVAMLGTYAAWELQSADLTIRSMDELSIYNIRRLFSEIGEGNSPDAEPEMQLETQTAKRRRGPWGGAPYDDEGDGSYVRVYR